MKSGARRTTEKEWGERREEKRREEGKKGRGEEGKMGRWETMDDSLVHYAIKVDNDKAGRSDWQPNTAISDLSACSISQTGKAEKAYRR